MRKSRHHDINDAGLGKAAATPLFNHLKVADIAKGVGDPQCYQGQAGEARFKVGDKLRVKDHPDLFYNQTPGYLRGVIGTVTKLVYESPAPEDEAWGHIDKVEWFYALLFRHEDVWTDDGPDTNPNDTIHAQVSERWLEPV
ncbi:MAG: nitrile hydratase subunit beta [Alphaproteobacteria bacterium]|jgi:thiocyanate hydrolase subunit alpha|nr:nitrile hydratase subunit beta [Alphaproteobacteria bacterium]